MKTFNNIPYADRIQWRIRGLWCLLAAMLVYMVVVGELHLGDSRIMSPLAETVSRIIFFGGMIYATMKIHRYRKLLASRRELKKQMIEETDERNRFLHEKSGGFVWDALFFVQLFLTLTASLADMTAFAFTMCTLGAMIAMKIAAYLYASRCTSDRE